MVLGGGGARVRSRGTAGRSKDGKSPFNDAAMRCGKRRAIAERTENFTERAQNKHRANAERNAERIPL